MIKPRARTAEGPDGAGTTLPPAEYTVPPLGPVPDRKTLADYIARYARSASTDSQLPEVAYPGLSSLEGSRLYSRTVGELMARSVGSDMDIDRLHALQARALRLQSLAFRRAQIDDQIRNIQKTMSSVPPLARTYLRNRVSDLQRQRDALQPPDLP